jgi:nitroreductase
MNSNSEILSQLIRTRRSISPGLLTNTAISETIIEEILENANWAPTHGITEPWRFTVFTGKGLETLGEFQANWYKDNTPEEQFLSAKFEKLKQNPLNCSHVISIGVSLNNKTNIPDIEEIESVACAVQNMSLTAHAHGVASLWGSGGVTYIKETNSFFGLEDKDLLVGFLYLGYPKTDLPQGRRTPIANKVRWVK